MIGTMTHSPDESTLLSQARAGSAEAFRLIVEAYHERLFRVILRIVHSRSDAEEVVQETFLKAFRSLHRFQEDSSLYTWLYRIAVNAAVDLSKKEQRRRHRSLNDDESFAEAASQPDFDAGPVARTEQEELRGMVRDGIQALPERYRVILVMREYGGHSYEELGEVLGLPKGTVESRLFRARAKLKAWLEERWADAGLDPESFGY